MRRFSALAVSGLVCLGLWSALTPAESGSATHYPVSTRESSAGIVPKDLSYEWGDVRRYGATGDGISDDTRALQNALDSGSDRVFFAKPPVKYMTDQLLLPSGTDLALEEGTIIEANSGYGRTDAVLLMRNVDNVRISGYGAIVQMPKAEYSGEFNHGVAVRGSANITVEGVTSRNTGGDGFYVGEGRGNRTFSQNVVLRDIVADNNRRQGLSIISVKGLRVVNPRLTNTSGTRPASAIDIEPDNNGHFLEDIVIDNPYSADNQGNGYNSYLNALPGPVDKHVSITINDATDERSASSFVVGKLDTKGYKVDGFIRFNRPRSIESRAMAFVARNYAANGPRLEFREPLAIRPNTDGHRSVKYGSAMVVFRERDDSGAANLGNVHFYDPQVRDDRNVPNTRHFFHIRDLSGPPVENVTISGTISGVGLPAPINMVIFDGSGEVEDRAGLLEHHTGSRNLSLVYSNYARRITNQGSSRAVTVSLGRVPAGWPPVTLEVREPNDFIVRSTIAGSFIASDRGQHRQMKSSTVGATVTLRHVANGEWRVLNVSGDWTYLP
jgi:hypothetical protein